ncbi:hypothetical protein IGI04_009310 [Brassica rapa subsp. trilocularis]|uniref:Uncharacterized protein n=1 Tax=Brassica rapa subsp. trilocularis TaxID=1813537 RepID=A0ABQ7MZA6_BRACM|nr:hypothetical protein IGI04_009310 [Brassica rapa subsp. trilocularis]
MGIQHLALTNRCEENLCVCGVSVESSSAGGCCSTVEVWLLRFWKARSLGTSDALAEIFFPHLFMASSPHMLRNSQESERRLCFDGEVYDPTTNTCSGIENVWPYLDSGGRGRIAGDIRGSSSSVYARSLGGGAVVMIGGTNESEGQGVVMKTSEKWSRVHGLRFGFSTPPFSHASI